MSGCPERPRPALIVVVLGVVAPLAAQTGQSATTNMDILTQKIKADKKLVVAQTMQLTGQEGKAFAKFRHRRRRS